MREKDIKDPLTGEFSPTFYKNIDHEEMLQALSKKYVYKKHAKDLVRYYERYVDIFFMKPELIQSESGHKRAWIVTQCENLEYSTTERCISPNLKF
jgi:hypothetical protein